MKNLLIVGLLFTPTFVFANVRINEVAWMGTSDSSTGEWIELYNDGDSSIDITDWMFSIGNKKLAGSIQGKGFLVLKRTTDYTGALTDSGLKLGLYDSTKTTEIDSVSAVCDPPGSGIVRDTIQRNGNTWIVAPETPNISNATNAGTGKNGTCEINGVKNQTEIDTTTDTNTDASDTTTSPSTTLDNSAHMSPLPISDFSQKQELYISAGRNRIVAAGSPVMFEAYAIDSKGVKSQNISATWSFGDGSQAGGVKAMHTYKYPGNYIVILNANAGGNEAVSRAEVRVFAPKIILALEDDGAVSLANNSENEINIGGWKIVGTNGTFIISSDTIVKAGKKIIFPPIVTGIDFSKCVSIELLSPDGVIVASFTKAPKPIIVVATTTPPAILVPEKISGTTAQEKIIPPIVSLKPRTQVAAAAVAVPETKAAETIPAQKIVLKKPEGFFAKIWNFFF